MRRLWIVAGLMLCLPMVGEGQEWIRYYPPTSTLTAGGSSFFAGGISLGNTVASPYANLYGDAANVLAQRNGTSAQSFYVYSTYTDAANYERGELGFDSGVFYITSRASGAGATRPLQLRSNSSTIIFANSTGTKFFNIENASKAAYPETSDDFAIGFATKQFTSGYIARSIQGSKSKALTDNTATAFVRLAVADDDYEGCAIGWTAVAEDANGDARQIRKGRTNVAILNNSGTEACNFSASADDQAILVTAGTFTCSFDCNSAAADTVDLRATCDTSLDAAAEILTFEYRLDCESIVTVTPQ